MKSSIVRVALAILKWGWTALEPCKEDCFLFFERTGVSNGFCSAKQENVDVVVVDLLKLGEESTTIFEWLEDASKHCWNAIAKHCWKSCTLPFALVKSAFGVPFELFMLAFIWFLKFETTQNIMQLQEMPIFFQFFMPTCYWLHNRLSSRSQKRFATHDVLHINYYVVVILIIELSSVYQCLKISTYYNW